MSEPTFEETLQELESIVERLEGGRAGLDEALALWQRGEQLYALCKSRLDAAEGKVEDLARRAQEAQTDGRQA
jgi:exodeoxyribonuclease VII small subunit